jgi:hypothetical protein
MNKLNENISVGVNAGSAAPSSALTPRDQTLKTINNEVKESHDWLNSVVGKPEGDEVDQSVTANRNLGWGEQQLAGKVLFKLNVDTKIERWVSEFPDIKVHAYKMWRPAKGGATHRCECDGAATAPAVVANRSKGLLTVINNTADLDDFYFYLSRSAIAGFTYSAYGKKWIRLIAVIKGNSIELTFG